MRYYSYKPHNLQVYNSYTKEQCNSCFIGVMFSRFILVQYMIYDCNTSTCPCVSQICPVSKKTCLILVYTTLVFTRRDSQLNDTLRYVIYYL